MKKFLLIIFLLILFSSCDAKPIKDVELDKLVSFLTGSFSNKEQSENDTGFAYLNLVNTRIWKNKPGYWVYSEVSDAKENHYIYYQKIINYERLDSSTFRSTSYKIPNIEDYKSNINNSQFFENLTLENLNIEIGCQVYFKKKTSTIFSGKTNKGSCNSNTDNINYTTSSYLISKGKISVWTKGYDIKGKQVWGKINGPYKYKKLSNQ